MNTKKLLLAAALACALPAASALAIYCGTKSTITANPTSGQTFSQAIAGYSQLVSYQFGSAAAGGTPVRNATDLATSFNPRDSRGTIAIGSNGEWEVYVNSFNDQAFTFDANDLALTAYIPPGGGLFAQGINSGMLALKQHFQPGVVPSGANFIAGELIAWTPSAQAAWPAFWGFDLASVTSGGPNEIDFLESPITNNLVFSCNTWNDGTGITPAALTSNRFLTPLWDGFKAQLGAKTRCDTFHSYAFVWSQDQLWVYLDGVAMGGWNYQYTSNVPIEIFVNFAFASTAWGQPMFPVTTAEFPVAYKIKSLTFWTSN